MPSGSSDWASTPCVRENAYGIRCAYPDACTTVAIETRKRPLRPRPRRRGSVAHQRRRGIDARRARRNPLRGKRGLGGISPEDPVGWCLPDLLTHQVVVALRREVAP